jgi:hypothetical protein
MVGMREQALADRSIDWFRPTWVRGLFAVASAAGAFFLPQAVPLEWYPLNNPGTDINYLEISCAANVTGNVEVRYDLAQRGHRPIDTIRWPISPTTQTYTYTFPLPDAPIVEMRVVPPSGGELTIRQMRIINRRGEELRRFTYDLFRTERASATIVPSTEGWKLISAPGASSPSTRIELFSPIIPVGQDHRNLLRCLLSTGYLSLMLWILLLAVLFVFHRPAGWRDLCVHLCFMAFIAVLFAAVGNRGLMRNSIHYARYSHPPAIPGLKLELDLISSGPAQAQVFWDTGNGVSEDESDRRDYEPHQGLQHLRFTLPDQPLKSLRFDPRNNAGRLEIRGIRIIDTGQRTSSVLPLDSLHAVREIAKLETGRDVLTIEVTPDGKDPITEFTPAAVEIVNRAVADQSKR